jgi:GT2 family glycosyltransferase
LKDALSRQTYKNFELIITEYGTIPEGRNNGLYKAMHSHSDKIIFLDADCIPWDRNWLREMVDSITPDSIVRCQEGMPTEWGTPTLGINKKDAEFFDEYFKVGEDIEWLNRDKIKSLKHITIPKAMVYHDKTSGGFKRAMQYGHYYTLMTLLKPKHLKPFKLYRLIGSKFKDIILSVLFIFSALITILAYPIYINKRIKQ